MALSYFRMFGGDCELSNLEVVKMILQETEKPKSLIRFVTDWPGHDKRYAVDFTKVNVKGTKANAHKTQNYPVFLNLRFQVPIRR